MENYLRRSILAIFGICAIVWAVNAVIVFPGRDRLAQVAQRMLSGERFNAAQLSAIKNLLAATPARTLRASDLSNAAMVRLWLWDDELKLGQRPPASDLVELQTAVGAAIDQSPSNSFMWLTDLWVKLRKGEFVDRDWNLLRMSYQSGPNDAWIAVRRNSLAVGVFQSLPDDLAEQALLEFARLVRSGFYSDAANILAGPGWAFRDKLLSRLVQIDEADRRAFAKVLESKNLDGVTVPGVDEKPTHPF